MPVFAHSVFRHTLSNRKEIDDAQVALVLCQIPVTNELMRFNKSIQFGGYNVIYKYELACKEAGLSEEQTAEIRRFFDAEQKHLKRDKKAREDAGITFSYIVTSEDESEEAGDLDSREIADENYDLEDIGMHNLLLEQLHKILQELSVDDREFLLAVFGERGSAVRYAKSHGMSEVQVTRKKKELLEDLRKIFFEKN